MQLQLLSASRRSDERGVTAAVVALTVVSLVTTIAMSINYNNHVATTIQLQNAVDEAAVAAATACAKLAEADREDDCGQSAAEAAVHARFPDADVTSALRAPTSSVEPVKVDVGAQIWEANFLAINVAGRARITVGAAGQPRALPESATTVRVGASKCSRAVDTGMGVSSDGNAYFWGYLYSLGGQPIDGGTKLPPARIPVPEGTTVAVAGQIYDANLLDSSGNVWGWGTYNDKNGTGATRPSNAPQKLRVNGAWNDTSKPFLSDIVAICDSEQAGAGIDTSGRVWSWGMSFYGGNGAKGATLLPGLPDPSVSGNRPVYIKGAYTNLFVILQNGDVYYIGGNSSLPPGNSSSSGTWKQVSGLTGFTKATAGPGNPYITAIDGGINMGGAVLSNGQVLSWSYANTKSRTGRDGTGVAVVPTLSNIVSQQFGFTGVAMIDTSKRLWGYGASDDYGKFPMAPALIDSNVVQFASGQGYYVWERSDGTWWGRGYNPQGAIGLPIGTRTTNQQVLFSGTNALSIISVN